jgi:hypothetical protein
MPKRPRRRGLSCCDGGPSLHCARHYCCPLAAPTAALAQEEPDVISDATIEFATVDMDTGVATVTGWRPRSGVNGSGCRLPGMLGGGGDGLVDYLLWHGRVEELAAEVLEQAQPFGGHGEAGPAAAGPVQHRPDQRQAGGLAGQPADHLGSPSGLPEGPLDQVAVADPSPVLGRKPQVDGEGGEIVGDAGDRYG